MSSSLAQRQFTCVVFRFISDLVIGVSIAMLAAAAATEPNEAASAVLNFNSDEQPAAN